MCVCVCKVILRGHPKSCIDIALLSAESSPASGRLHTIRGKMAPIHFNLASRDVDLLNPLVCLLISLSEDVRALCVCALYSMSKDTRTCVRVCGVSAINTPVRQSITHVMVSLNH